MISSGVRNPASERSRAIAFCGLAIALMAVSAWVTIPLGPLPFTLQTFVMIFVIVTFPPKMAIASIGGYLILGALGVPLFTAMRGGLGVILGPTGGFLWGFFFGALLAVGFLHLTRHWAERSTAARILCCGVAGLIFIALSYVCGAAQLVLLSGMTLAEAIAVGVAPFVIVDLAKLVAAVAMSLTVRKAIG